MLNPEKRNKMYRTRQATPIKIPLPRKGTKYVVRASSHSNDSIPVSIAVRDMLNLAKNAKEVKKNGKPKTH